MTDVLLPSFSGRPRRFTKVFKTSDAAYAIPVWAQGGKGIAYITGTAPGGSGAVNVTSGRRGSGGSSGAYAIRLPVPIPTGVTTIAAVIGSPGAAVTATAVTAGNNGGDTTLTVGSYTLLLGGGLGGPSNDVSVAQGGRPNPVIGVLAQAGVGENATDISAPVPNMLSRGYASTAGSGTGRGAGGESPFGRAGDGLASGPTVTTNGAAGTGFGAGGAGALWISGGAAVSGAGAPSFLEVEFVEVA